MSITPNFTKLKPDWALWFFNPDNKIFSILSDTSTYYIEKDFYTSFYMLSFNDTNVLFLNSNFKINSEGLMSENLYETYKSLKNCGYYPTIDGKIDRWILQGIFLLNIDNISKELSKEILEKFLKKDKLIWVINKNFKLEIPQNHTIFFFEDEILFKKINRELKHMDKNEINW